MKKYILAAALVLASTSAMADRTVSGVTKYDFDRNSKNKACEGAKHEAKGQIENGSEQVESFSKCECDETKDGYGHPFWTCSVDAKLEKLEKKH